MVGKEQAGKANLRGSKGWRGEKKPSPLNPAYTYLYQNEDGKQRTHRQQHYTN